MKPVSHQQEFEAWLAGDKIPKQSEMEAIETIQNQSLKKILHLAVTTKTMTRDKKTMTSTAIFHVVCTSFKRTTLAEMET